MIPSDLRLYAPDGHIGVYPQDPAIWNFVDFDTRKWIMFEGPVEPFGMDDGELAQEVLLSVIDELGDDVTKVTFAADGKRWKATNFPNDDITPVVSYPKFTATEVGHLASVTLKNGLWEEIDRIGPGLDVIRTWAAGELFAFKYYLVPRDEAERTAWIAPFYHQALSAHPNIVPFGDFVVDEGTHQLVGYTTKYISGGSLETRHLPVFKRSWIKQLTNLIDHLNLQYGLFHQDIAPRNLVLDEKHDRLLLFDFENAALHGSEYVLKLIDDPTDLCFTIYEILTGDNETGHDRGTRKSQLIMNSAKHWRLKRDVKLEPDVSMDMIKNELNEWIQKRQKATPSAFEHQTSIYCPEMKIEEVKKANVGEHDSTSFPAYYIKSADPKAQIVRWERPSTAQLRSRRSAIE